jgi:cell division protein FtsW (lipid II flippase)
MAAAGAPAVQLAVNALSLLIALALFAAVPTSALPSRRSGAIVLALGALLLATALFGVSVEGASRWIRVEGLALQTSLIVLPPMLVAFARRRGLLATIGMIVAGVALALQPDRAMAGVLAAALAALAIRGRDRWVLSSFAVAVAGFAVTLIRPDTLPAVPWVDQLLYSSFQVHPLAGIAMVCGALLLVVPSIVGGRFDPSHRDVHAVFGTVWLGAVLAAALGNYPTPLVGYGGSAILGYLLSLSFIPGKAATAAVAKEQAEAAAPTETISDRELRSAANHGTPCARVSIRS